MIDKEFEFKTTSKLKESEKEDGCEMLVFSFPLFGNFEIVAICIIPSQNETVAPVYIKIRNKQKEKKFNKKLQ